MSCMPHSVVKVFMCGDIPAAVWASIPAQVQLQTLWCDPGLPNPHPPCLASLTSLDIGAFDGIAELSTCCPMLECLRVCGTRTTEDLWEPLTRLSHLKDLTLHFNAKGSVPLRKQNMDNLLMLETIRVEGPCCGFSGQICTGASFSVDKCIHFSMTHLK